MRSYLILLFFWAGAAVAQTFPNYQNTTVNDYADLLSDADEATLSKQLQTLRDDTGVEMTVLTLKSQSVYAPNLKMEEFATALFNEWGIGDKDRNDGVLVMVLREDRAMRIELGAAFGRDWDKAAARVVDGDFLPHFKNDDYARGIKQGTTATINTIVTPFLGGEEPPKQDSGGWLIGVFVAVFGLFFGRRWIGDKMARFRTCPNCGQRGLEQTRRTIRSATKSSTGLGRKRVTCSHCNYENESDYTISRLSSGSSSSFGGGSSGGGGASGRW